MRGLVKSALRWVVDAIESQGFRTLLLLLSTSALALTLFLSVIGAIYPLGLLLALFFVEIVLVGINLTIALRDLLE